MSITLSSGQVLLAVHDEGTCLGEYCALHNPSDHYYKDYPLYFNVHVGVWERITIGADTVPDPDNLVFQNSRTVIYENKIECIKCSDVIESTHRHDFNHCMCGNVAVDGGRAYLRRIGSEYIERSVIKENPVYA